MKVSFKWLSEFVEIGVNPRELAHKLTHAGLEVESVQIVGKLPDSVKVVQIEKIEKHPQADRLSLCTVSLGSETQLIVCGAQNMKAGDKVALAQPGTLLPDGKKIERSKIRGIESAGMLCSEVELGLFEEAKGLMILPAHLRPGAPLSSQMDLEDAILEVNITPNRADCLSIYGMAREVSALLGVPLKAPKCELPAATASMEGRIKLEMKNPELCPRYTLRAIQGVKIGPSPFEARLKLHRVGVRSINNVVDATNYVMMEWGQPLHAFDWSRIQGGKIVVRSAQAGEKAKTLDEAERNLEASDLVIADGSRVLAIAGVMGCADSGVSEASQDLLLESAYFSPQSVRKTSRRLGLQTESSYRFERGVDPNASLLASDRLASLILQWAGGQLCRETFDTAQAPFPLKTLSIRLSRIRQVLGVDWSEAEVEKALAALNLSPRKIKEGEWACEVPSYRQDLSREIDLLEEVARLVGYDKIPPSLPKLRLQVAKDHYESSLEESIRPLLAHEGFHEVIHYSFGSEKDFKKCPTSLGSLVELANPLSEEMAFLRPSLVPSMLACLRHNMARQFEDLRFFELRNIYGQSSSGEMREAKSLVLAMSGKRNGQAWNLPKEDCDFYDLKGLVEKIWKNYNLPEPELKLSSSPFFHPGASAALWVGEKKVGDFGQVHPQWIEAFDLRGAVVMGEFDLGAMASLPTQRPPFEEIPKFPGVGRDLTVIAPDSLSSRDVIDCIASLGIAWLKKMDCVDVYSGEPIEKGKKALTYSILYLDPEKTLTDVEVNQVHQQVMDHLKKVLPIQWR